MRTRSVNAHTRDEMCEHFEERNSKFHNGILLLAQAYHIETSLLFMSTYIRIFDGFKFYVHIETSLLLVSTYNTILECLRMVSASHRRF